MKTMQKLVLYLAAGAALLGGCYRSAPEKPVQQPSPLEYKATEQRSELGLEEFSKVLQEAVDFDKECQRKQPFEEQEARKEALKELGSFEDWLKKRSSDYK